MSSNFSTNIDKVKHQEDYVRNIFRDILSGPNSILNRFIERNKDYWEKVTEVL